MLCSTYTKFIHSFIAAISIAPLQVLFYSEALVTHVHDIVTKAAKKNVTTIDISTLEVATESLVAKEINDVFLLFFHFCDGLS